MGSGTNVVLDIHGWLNKTYGNSEVASYFGQQFGFSHNNTHGKGYLETWAFNQGAKSCLIELPQPASSGSIVSGNYAGKLADGLVNMVQNIKGGSATEGGTVVNQSCRVQTTSSVNVRSGPGTSYSKVASLTNGTQVTRIKLGVATANGYVWDKIAMSDGKIGYMATNYLVLITDNSSYEKYQSYDEIMAVKAFLKYETDIYSGVIDKMYNNELIGAVEEWQKAFNLSVQDGSLNAETLQNMGFEVDSISRIIKNTFYNNYIDIANRFLAGEFEPENYAFSVGAKYEEPDGSAGIDTTVDATTAWEAYSSAGYRSFYTTFPTDEVLRGNFNPLVKKVQSGVLFFSGHGNYDGMSFYFKQDGVIKYSGLYYEDDKGFPTHRVIGIKNNMEHVKLVTFAGCLTASTTDNITKRAVEYGAKTAVGWTESIAQGAHTNWLTRYNNQLVAGATVREAADFANEFIYSDISVRTVVIEGNDQLRIAQISPLTKSNNIETIQYLSNVQKQNVVFDGNVDVDMVISQIKNTVPEFDKNLYSITVQDHKDSNFTVVITRKIGDFETDSCYIASIKNGELQHIADWGKESLIKNRNISIKHFNALSSNKRLADKALSKARKSLESLPDIEIIEQSIKYHYDIDADKPQIIVFTTYGPTGSNAQSVHEYIMDI